MTTSKQTVLGEEVPEADLTVRRRNYFRDLPLDDYTQASRERFGLGDEGTVHRHSYLYTQEYDVSGDERGDSETGEIEIRARIWTRSPNLTSTLKSVLKKTAHGAAHFFNSSVEAAKYGRDGGYLDGFHGRKVKQHFEKETVGGAAGGNAQVGKVDWNVEIYNEDDQLSGIAQGVANPWTRTDEQIEGEASVDVAPHKWRLTYQEANGYDVHPDPRSNASDRYRDGAGAGKQVYVNGEKIGKLDAKGRTFLKPEYQHGLTWHDGQHSREGLIEKTPATPQALRKGGVLYHVGESEQGVYLRTAAALPDGYEAADSDDVAVDVEARAGRPGGVRHVLDVRDAAYIFQCRRDEKIIRHLGFSMPTWSHETTKGWPHGGA